MKQAPILVIALALAACAPRPVAGPDVATSLDRASIDVRSWGRLVHRWTVGADGAVEHVIDPSPFGSPAKPLDVRHTTLDEGQRAALGGALDKVAIIASKPQGCTSEVTDMPYGRLSWTQGGQAHDLEWRSNCLDGRDADLWRAIKKADGIVDKAAMATPVVKTVPNDEGGKGR